MTNPREVAVRLAALKALYDRVKDAYNAARAEAADTLQPGDRLRAALPDGANIGTVTVVEGRTTAKVVDPEALLAWVQVNAPTEIETVARVRESYVGALLSRCENVDGAAVHGKTGELLPGVGFTVGDTYARVTATHDQQAAFVEAWLDGSLIDAMPDSIVLRALAEEPGHGERSLRERFPWPGDITAERFTLHRRNDPAPNPNTPLPVDTVENGAEGVEDG